MNTPTGVAPDPIHFGFVRFLYPFARPQAASFLLHLDSVAPDPIHFGFSRFLYPFARPQAAYFLPSRYRQATVTAQKGVIDKQDKTMYNVKKPCMFFAFYAWLCSQTAKSLPQQLSISLKIYNPGQAFLSNIKALERGNFPIWEPQEAENQNSPSNSVKDDIYEKVIGTVNGGIPCFFSGGLPKQKAS